MSSRSLFHLEVFPDRPPNVVFRGSLQQRRQFSCLGIAERIEQIHRDHKLIWPTQPPAEKSAALAIAARERGSDLVRAGKWREAIAELNTATRYLEPDQVEECGWVAASRSAASFALGLYTECLEDCRLALSSLPPSLALQRSRLWQRSAQCWAVVGEKAAVDKVVDMVRSELEAAGVKEEAQEKLLAGLQSAVRKSESETRKEEGRLPRPRLTAPGRNQMVSSKLTVEVAEGVAMRYVVATEDIKAGEVLVEEMPVSSVLVPRLRHSHCSTCLRPAIAGVACQSCSNVIFCSTGCRDQAASSFHGPECKSPLPHFGSLDPALRLLTLHPVQWFQKMEESLFKDHNPRAGWREGIKAEDMMRAAFDMQAKESDPEHSVKVSGLAYIALVALHRMGCLSTEPSAPLNLGKQEHLMARLAHHFLLAVGDNSHQVVELLQPGSDYVGSLDSLYDGDQPVIEVIGAALNSVTSLFNNSCDVNTVKFHQGRKTIMLARRDIKAGEEVSDFYGQHYFQAPRSERLAALRFPCSCAACRHDWPLLSSMAGFPQAMLKKKKSWASAKASLDKAVANMEVEQVFKLASCLGQLAGVAHPHRELIMPELYLHYSAVFLWGNKSLEFQLFVKELQRQKENMTMKENMKMKEKRRVEDCTSSQR